MRTMLEKFSVKKPFTVVVAVLLILILGVVSFTEMTTDLLPSIDLPYVIVVTTYPGASPEEVEQTVTRPVEQNMATINNIKNINSTSSENVSMVILEFNDDANMDSITIDIRESLDMIEGAWSDSVGSPVIMKLNPDMMPVMVAAMDVDGMTTAEVSRYAEETILPKLESIDGVASVSASGLIEEKVNVILRQDKIDKINQKLKESVEKQLKDAEKELKKAKKEIEKGKKELEQKIKEFNEGISEGEQGVLSGRLELLKGEIEVANGEEELKTKENELLASEKELKKKEAELSKTEQDLKTKQKEANDGLKEIKTAEQELETNLKQLEESKKILEESLASIEANEELSEQEKEASKTGLETKLAELESGIAKIEASQIQLKTQKEQIEAGLTEIKAGLKKIEEGKPELALARTQLEAGKSALAAAKQKMSSGKSGITSGKETLDEKEQELNTTKKEVGTELENAAKELEAGEKEIQSQLDNLKNTKKEALEKATVNDTITADMITQILQAENFSMPAGYVTEEGVDYLVRVGDKVQDVEELNKLVLFDLDIEDMDPITLNDVADVFWTDNASETYAKINGNDGVILSMQKQTTYSTAEVAEKISNKFEEIKEEKEGIHFTTLMDQGMYINLVVDSVLNNLIMGAVLAILILLLFLKDLKPTFIIACSIPISVIFAIVLMYFSGVTLNIISLSGLAVGVGMLVDNSVVVIENIYRLRGKGVSAIKSAVTGATQVAGAIIASTLTTICVFLPIVFVKGITRQLFTDMALTIAYSLLASLIVALTLVPMMSSTMLQKTKEKKHKIFDKFVAGYEFLITHALKIKPIVLILAIVILVISIKGAMGNGTAFMTEMDSTQISVDMEMPEGAILQDTVEMSNTIIERIHTIEDVETVGAMLASSNASMMGMGSGASSENKVSMYVILKEEKTKSSQEIAQEILEKCQDLECEVTASGSSMDMSALGGSGISIKVKGNELDSLQTIATDVAKRLEEIEGVTEISDGMENPTPELRVTIQKEKAMLEGLTVAQVYMELRNAISDAATATNLSIDGKEYAVDIHTEASKEMIREDIQNYVIETKTKEGETKKIKLKNVAEFSDRMSLSSINREAQTRYITVSASLEEGYNIGLVSREVEKSFKDYEVPKGIELEFAGENETINESLFELGKMLILAVAFIYLIMVAQFQSVLSPFIVIFTIPLAFTGGFLGLWITGNELSVIAMIGFVMLSGIVVNNGIVLVDYINQLRREGVEKREAIIEAGVTRMRPILMTALTTILGLSTMAIGVGMGSEMMQPIAIVTIGGLLYATITTLFVIPALYDIFNRKELRVIRDEDMEYVEEDEMLIK